MFGKFIKWAIIIGILYGAFKIGYYIFNQGVLFVFSIVLIIIMGMLAIKLVHRARSED